MPTYNKLVRDKIPHIIKQTGKRFSTKLLNEEAYIQELKKKMHEELAEYEAANSKAEALEELADLLELIHAAAHVHNSSMKEIEKIRLEKAEKRGQFNERIFLIEVEDD